MFPVREIVTWKLESYQLAISGCICECVSTGQVSRSDRLLVHLFLVHSELNVCNWRMIDETNLWVEIRSYLYDPPGISTRLGCPSGKQLQCISVCFNYSYLSDDVQSVDKESVRDWRINLFYEASKLRLEASREYGSDLNSVRRSKICFKWWKWFISHNDQEAHYLKLLSYSGLVWKYYSLRQE